MRIVIYERPLNSLKEAAGGPRYPRVCYSRFQLTAASELCTKLVIRGHFPWLSADLVPF